MSKTANNTEIRIVGLRRSGNHAIINWLASHYKGKVCFLNNVKPLMNPFLSFDKSVLAFNKNFYQDFNINDEREGKFSKKDCLIYNYEDQPLKQIFHKKFEKNHQKFVGKSKRSYNVLILRDPYNLFASRIFRSKDEEKAISEIKVIKLWKNYAREYVGKTKYLGKNKIVINYNFWFSNENYRREIEKELGLKPNDTKIKEVINIGRGDSKGSSFDGMKFNGKANKMKVLERWKSLIDNKFYRIILVDKELNRLSNKIFGKNQESENIRGNIYPNLKIITKIKVILGSKSQYRLVRIIRIKTKQIINNVDRLIGIFGIFLKKRFPKVYYQLKK